MREEYRRGMRDGDWGPGGPGRPEWGPGPGRGPGRRGGERGDRGERGGDRGDRGDRGYGGRHWARHDGPFPSFGPMGSMGGPGALRGAMFDRSFGRGPRARK